MRYFRARARSRRFLLVCGAVGVIVLGGSAIAYAAGAIPGANGVIQGCYAPQDNYSLRVTSTTCPKGTVALSWNQQGPKGNPGTSVTSSPLSSGDSNCPNGGSSFTSASGTTYACNGAKGDPGPSDITPPVGQFTPTQLVQGGVLTCNTVGSNSTDTACNGLLLNGKQVAFYSEAANRICATVTGGVPFVSSSGSGSSDTRFDWNGTSWSLVTSPSDLVSIDCFR